MKYIYVCTTNPACDTVEKAYENKAYLMAKKLLPIFGLDDVVFDVCPDGEGEQNNLRELLIVNDNVIITPKPTTLAPKFEIWSIVNEIVKTGNNVLFCELADDGNLIVDTMSTISIDDVI